MPSPPWPAVYPLTCNQEMALGAGKEVVDYSTTSHVRAMEEIKS